MKSVLFIAPAFFEYEISIKDAIQQNGYDVDYFDERTSNNSFLKAIFRVKKDFLERWINRYYSIILKTISNKKYNYFLLIKGEVIPKWFVIEFKRLNPESKLIYYTYDSIYLNNKNPESFLKYFDSCYSFDFKDVMHNPDVFKLKHLFYTKDFIAKDQPDKKYTISFVGTLHSNRYAQVKKLFSYFDKTLVFFYSPAKWFFLFEKLFKKSHRSVKWSDVSFNKLNIRQVANIFKSSNSVLDIQRSGQTGLTMRTFEVLAAGALLITTNDYIKEAGFYNPLFIVVLDELDWEEKIDEIREKINALKTSKKSLFTESDEFYISNWVKEFFI
ncbi:MAG: hypothetical protein JWP44_1485 [Mucilaginibacter sp.]|nr:hypothetical protein [Mucilaginibacter sp.]